VWVLQGGGGAGGRDQVTGYFGDQCGPLRLTAKNPQFGLGQGRQGDNQYQ